MSVYCHPLMACIPNGRFKWRESTHMVADSLDELHSFAMSIGLKRAWFQDGRLKHYDLNPGRFDAAVKAGIVVIPTRDFALRFIMPTRLDGAK